MKSRPLVYGLKYKNEKMIGSLSRYDLQENDEILYFIDSHLFEQ